ncbi:DUF3037 domain-containing protein [Chitinophaga barathri]|uniref:DUF3037 domain-containing protein n=1 Tax=Chitinophaga barathri TaxID=1647451 RepID=A0A3N4M4Z3_9BACT|nr:DUF3037 domain-containing protein [Chitinophaga barathri]RPD38234.1 DUF3037 domain-containing protein [Chitinophaga barathri]
MPDNHLYEYAVIRVVPRVEREEFLNIGVILFCKQKKFLQAMITLNEEKLRILYPELDIEALKGYVMAFEKVTHGEGPIGQLDLASRFRWLTAMRSSILQTSRVHPGLCGGSPEETVNRLHAELVL